MLWAIMRDYPNYEISPCGQIRNAKTMKILKQGIDSRGYYGVTLSVDGKGSRVRIHRLVAIAFVAGEKKGLVVNHIGADKLDNHYKNLEWVTQLQNVRHAIKAGLWERGK